MLTGCGCTLFSVTFSRLLLAHQVVQNSYIQMVQELTFIVFYKVQETLYCKPVFKLV